MSLAYLDTAGTRQFFPVLTCFCLSIQENIKSVLGIIVQKHEISLRKMTYSTVFADMILKHEQNITPYSPPRAEAYASILANCLPGIQ